MRRAQAGDGVHHQQSAAVRLLEKLGHTLHVVAHAGRGFGRLHEHGARLDLQRLAHFVQREGLPIGRAHHIHGAAESFGQGNPALAEFSRGEHQHPVAGRGQVRDRSFHGAGARGGEQQHIVLRADKGLQLSEHALVQSAELRRAVMDIGGRHGELRGRKQRSRAGREKSCLPDHRLWFPLPTIVLSTRRPRFVSIMEGLESQMTHVSIAAQIEKDIIAAMKARDAERTTALRMVKTALKNKEIEKRAPLDEAESLQMLTTLIKQRRDSIEQFTKGNRPELAAKEAAEIEMIEGYMPKAAGEQEIRKLVEETLAELACFRNTTSGQRTWELR